MNNFKYKKQVEEIILDECYDFSEELFYEEVADFFSTALVRFKQGKKIFDIEDCGGYRVRIVNNAAFSTQPSSYVAVSNEDGEALSDMCYPFWNKYDDEDDEYCLKNMLSAFNEAYYRFISACI